MTYDEIRDRLQKIRARRAKLTPPPKRPMPIWIPCWPNWTS